MNGPEPFIAGGIRFVVAEPWVERHRPRRLNEVVGNAQAVEALRRWGESWKVGTPKERATLLAGPPGCGKTSAAHALAAEFGWEVLELNASDARSAPAIQRVAGLGSVHQTFSSGGDYQTSQKGQRKLIILDEADNLYERASEETEAQGTDWSDRGGKRAIVETVLHTRQPIVLIANDAYALTRGAGERLAKVTLRVPFRRLAAPVVKKVLAAVAVAEGVDVTDEVLQALVIGAHGDLRSAINDLEAVAAGRRRVHVLPSFALGERNRTETAFDAVGRILQATDMDRAITAARNLDEPPDFLLAWLDENVPMEYRRPEDLERALLALSSADILLGRAMRRQHFALWGYATEMMAGGVAAAKAQPYGTPPHYRFPGWILHMSRSKGARDLRSRLAEKLGHAMHLGSKAVVQDVLPSLGAMCRRDQELAESVSLRFELDEDEVRSLLGRGAAEAYVEEVVAHVAGRRTASTNPQTHLRPHAPTPAPRGEKASRQRSTRLGDF